MTKRTTYCYSRTYKDFYTKMTQNLGYIYIWPAKLIAYIIFLPILFVIGVLIWIDWKLHYKGLPKEAWGMPHPQ